MAVWCRCKCHHATLGNRNEQEQRGNAAGVEYFRTEDDFRIPPMVAFNDQLEILVAQNCGKCCDEHVRLRTFNPPPPNVPPIHLILPPPNPFDPESPSQSQEGTDDDTD